MERRKSKSGEGLHFRLPGGRAERLIKGIPFSLNFATSARVHGPLTEEALRDALARLRRRHPLMAVRAEVGPNGVDSYFTTEGVPDIPLRIVERRGEGDWVGEVEREIEQRSNYGIGPLFRCIWLRGMEVSDLLLVCDHVTADGRAGMVALRDLLGMLADPGLASEPLIAPRLAEIVPPHLIARIEAVAAAGAGRAPGFPPGSDSTPPEPLRVIPFELSDGATAALVSRCRQERATVQSALCAAFGTTFAERDPGSPIRRIESPVDIRPRLTQPVEDVYAGYLSLAVTEADCRPGRNLWDAARETKAALRAVTEEQLFTIPTIVMMVSGRPPAGPPITVAYDLSISNLGRIDIPSRYGPFQLESIYAPTLNVSLPGHRLLGVNTFAGRMRCTFTSRDPQAPDIVRRGRELLAQMMA